MADISLTAGIRANLLNLQQTNTLLERTQNRLSTGKNVNSALDDPIKFFAAQAHTQRASDLASLKSDMGESIQLVKAADTGIKGLTGLIAAAQGLIQSARSSDTAGRAALADQFNSLLTQIDTLATDSGYKGTNLLNAGSLKVVFNETDTANLTITGFDATSTGLSVGTVVADTLSVQTFASNAAQASVAEQASLAAVASLNLTLGASIGTFTAQASQASLASIASVASQASIGSIASQASAVAYGTYASVASVASRESQAAVASAASRAAVASYDLSTYTAASDTIVASDTLAITVSLASVASQASQASVASIAANSISQAADVWNDTSLETTATSLKAALTELRTQSAGFATNLNIVTLRQDFTTNLTNVLTTGADNLTLADTNEEGANMLMLQTRQALGTTALSLASQAAQAVLRLF